MRCGWATIATLAVTAPAGAGDPEVTPVDYSVAVGTDGSATKVTVTIRLIGDRDGETIIALPGQWAGSERLWATLDQRRVTGGQLVPSDDAAKMRIRHAAGAAIAINYRVRDARRAVPGANDYEKARPVVRGDWFHMLGEGAFAMPEGREASPARFGWGAVPRGWRVAADIEAVATPLTVQGVVQSTLIGGRALRVTRRMVAGSPLRVAMLGEWPYRDAELVDRLARLIEAENAMLGQPAVPYLVSLMPLTGSASGALSHGGTGRTAGFALTATDNVPLGTLTRTMAHEYAHRWFGQGFGGVAEGAGPYWFTEGVNDWFAARAMVASGLWSTHAWAASLDETLLRYGSSTARGLTDAQVSERFWTDPDAMQVQYDRGHLSALLLDRRLPGGLIAVLRAMAAARSDEDQVAHFSRLADARAPHALAQARQAVAAPLDRNALAACGQLVDAVQPRYDRGYDVDADRQVTKVRTAAARAAGLRVKMRVIRRVSFTPDDSSGLFVLLVADGAKQRTLRWYPRGDGTVRFQKLVPDAIGTPACRAMVAGGVPAA